MRLKLIILISLISLLIGCLIFLRTLPRLVMEGHFQSLCYKVIDVQNFAKIHNKMFFPQLFKREVENYMTKSIPQAQKEMDEVIEEANELYSDFLKNPAKELSRKDYEIKFDNYERALDSCEFGVYVGILHITDKYLLIPFGGLPTDWSGTIAEVFMPYFEEYNINYSNLRELGNYLDQKQTELNKINDKIRNYKISQNDIKNKRLLHKYENQKIYYYYYKNFDPLKYEKPKEIETKEHEIYSIFIYDTNYLSDEFLGRNIWNEKYHGYDYIKIQEDNGGWMFEMILTGISHKPKYFIRGKNGCENSSYEGDCPDICEFSPNSNKQIKYTINPFTGKIVKQMEFDNGPIGLGNICYPDWVPGMDI